MELYPPRAGGRRGPRGAGCVGGDATQRGMQCSGGWCVVLVFERNVRDYAAGLDYTKISIDIYILADALNLITFERLAILRLVCAG